VLVTLLTRGDGNGTWLLTMSGAIDACDPQVLGNYVSALDMAVALATAASRTRVAMLLSPVVRFTGQAGGGFEAALDALRVALTASRASIAVESTGRRVVYHGRIRRGRLGNRRSGPRAHAGAACNAGRRRRDADARAGRPASTSRRSSTAWRWWPRAAGDWVVKPVAIETADAVTVFGRTIERLASEALDRGLAVTAVVVATNGAAPAPRRRSSTSSAARCASPTW
jgi:hypothetical protein